MLFRSVVVICFPLAWGRYPGLTRGICWRKQGDGNWFLCPGPGEGKIEEIVLTSLERGGGLC